MNARGDVSLMNETSNRFKMRRAIRNFLGASVLCGVFASAGCGYVAPTVAPSPMSERIDWGMSLLAAGYVGSGQFPAKFSFDVNAPPDCANDFVVFNTSHFDSSGASANIMAFNNLYSTQGSVGGMCDQDGPSVYWSYFNNEGGARTSVALSLDGSKVAFVQSGGFGTAVLSILKWKAGEGSGAGSPVAVDQDISGSPWTACTDGNSCIAVVPFTGPAQNSLSAPYVDYANDVIYVGDSKGSLHKFTGVFNGTPTEVTSDWPILVNSTHALTSPVYDTESGNIFIGDASGRLSYVRDTSSTVGSCASGSVPCLGALTQQVGTAGAIVDSPILDSTSGFVFAVNGTDTLHHGTILQATTDLSSAVQFSIGGTGTTGVQTLYDGAFDNTYYNSSAGSVAGFMYVCGKDPANLNRPAIYQLSFSSGGVLNSVGTPLLMNSTSNNAVCSPITEFNNTGSSPASGDWIFFSIGNSAASAAPIPTNSNCRRSVDLTNGGRGCMLEINLTNATNPSINPTGTWPPVAAFFTAQGGNNNANAVALPTNTAGASSGIIVDNVYEVSSILDGSNISQTSSLYFSTPTSSGAGPGLPNCNTTTGVGCAVKLTQSNLN
jgi:hypothetical protein